MSGGQATGAVGAAIAARRQERGTVRSASALRFKYSPCRPSLVSLAVAVVVVVVVEEEEEEEEEEVLELELSSTIGSGAPCAAAGNPGGTASSEGRGGREWGRPAEGACLPTKTTVPKPPSSSAAQVRLTSIVRCSRACRGAQGRGAARLGPVSVGDE